MIAIVYGKVQIDWLQHLISEIGMGRGITRRIPDDGLKCATTLKSGNFQSHSPHL